MYIPAMAGLKLMMKLAFFVETLRVIVSLDKKNFSLVLPNSLDQVCIKIQLY